MVVDPTVVQPAMRRRHTWRVLVVPGAVVLGLAAWLAVGLTPHAAAGAFGRADPEAHLVPAGADGTTRDRSIVTDPSDGSNDATWSFRNAGRLPVEVRVASAQPAAPVLAQVRVFAIDPSDPSWGAGGASDVVRLRPHEEVGVLVSVGFGCAPWEAGTGPLVESVDLRVTTLAITRAITVEGSASVGVETTGDLPGRGCD
jgi:hypothetical protein